MNLIFTNLGVPKVDGVVVLPPKGFLLASAALGVDPSPLKNPPPPPPEPPKNSTINYKFDYRGSNTEVTLIKWSPGVVPDAHPPIQIRTLLKQKRFKKIAWLRSPHLHLH